MISVGFSPNELLFGFNPHQPETTLQIEEELRLPRQFSSPGLSRGDAGLYSGKVAAMRLDGLDSAAREIVVTAMSRTVTAGER